MKNTLVGLLLLFLVAASALAQNQGDDTPLGSSGTKILCNANGALANTVSADGKLNYVACSTSGQILTSGATTSIVPGVAATSLGKAEDAVHASGDTGVQSLFVREDALTVSSSTTGDYQTPKTDAMGRLIVTPGPAGEFWSACGTATATTSNVAIKAAVVSTRTYVTSLTCKNTSATVATSIDFKDGTTTVAVGGVAQMATTSDGSFSASFPVPLRGTSNTAFNFATNVSVSSVTCCGAGYTAVN